VEHIRRSARNVTKYFTHINRGKTGKTLFPTALTAMLYSMGLVFQTACGVMQMLTHVKIVYVLKKWLKIAATAILIRQPR